MTDPRPVGRPELYDKEAVLDVVLPRLASGESLRSICKSSDELPGASTIRLWCLEDEAINERYTRARDLGLDEQADEVLEIADDRNGDADVQSRRLRFDARRWYLSKLAPKRYGEKVLNEHAGEGGGPLVVQVVKFSDTNADDPAS